MAETQFKERQGGQYAQDFCSAAHPDNPPVPAAGEYDQPGQSWAWCRRLPHGDGPHRAYTFSIREPEEWY